MCFHIVCGCLGALIAELTSCDRGHMACKDEDTLWPVQKKCANSCKMPRVYGRKNGTWEAAPRQAYQEGEASPLGWWWWPWWEQMLSEARDLVSGRLGEHPPPAEGRRGTEGPGRTAKGVQKSCRENRPPPPHRRRPPAAAFNPTARVHPSWHGRRAQCGAWKPDGTCDAKKTLPWEKDPTL